MRKTHHAIWGWRDSAERATSESHGRLTAGRTRHPENLAEISPIRGIFVLASVLIFQVLIWGSPAPLAENTDGQPAAPLKIGQPAPEITLESLLQAPGHAKATREALLGKVVVLEFWGTYCAPCIAALAHLNRLVGEFEKEPVQFIAITHENREVVERFLSRREIVGWVGLDTDESVFIPRVPRRSRSNNNRDRQPGPAGSKGTSN